MQIPRPVMRAIVRWIVRPILGTRLKVSTQRRAVELVCSVAVLPKRTTIDDTSIGGVPAKLVRTPATGTGRALLYLHGGGYTVCSPRTHRAIASHLTEALGAEGYVLDYRLAPEHPCPAAIDDAVAAYRGLLAQGFEPEEIFVAGDSAGGNLALTMSLRARAEGLPLPAALGLFSPWVDLTSAHLLDGTDGHDGHDGVDDPLLTAAWLRRCAHDYAGVDTARPEASPLYADLAGLPPLVVQASSDEIIRADVERLVGAAEEAGVPVDFEILDGHWHVSQLFAGLMAESSGAVERMGTRLARLSQSA